MLTILAAAGVHGLWNTLAILIVLLPFITSTGAQTALLQGSLGIGTLLMASILILLAAALFLMNRRLHRETQSTQPGVSLPTSI